MEALLRQLQPRTLLLLLASLAGLTLLAAWLYLFRTDLQDLRRLDREHARALREVDVQQRLVAGHRVQDLEREVAALDARVNGKHARLGPGEMVSRIIGGLDAIGTRHAVELIGVRPGPRDKLLGFEEVPFDVEVRGRYMDLFAWLQAAERELSPMVFKQFHLAPEPSGGMLKMELRVVSYRPAA